MKYLFLALLLIGCQSQEDIERKYAEVQEYNKELAKNFELLRKIEPDVIGFTIKQNKYPKKDEVVGLAGGYTLADNENMKKWIYEWAVKELENKPALKEEDYIRFAIPGSN